MFVPYNLLSFGFEFDLLNFWMDLQEGLEALVEEVATKAAPLRSSSKRSRAAEVHNLSEKVGL